MPQNCRPSVKAFNLNLFDAEELKSKSGRRIALRSIKSVCFQADSAILEMVVALSSRPYLLEYIFSCMLRMLVAACEFLVLTVPRPSAGQGDVREVVQMDHFEVPHTHNPKCHGYYQHGTPPETFLFVVVRGVLAHY